MPVRRIIALACMALSLSACKAVAPVAKVMETETETVRALSSKGSLINEGGPVFALPGDVRMPATFAGETAGMIIKAERLSGGRVPRIADAVLDGTGHFSMSVPTGQTDKFFATTSFEQDGSTHKLRALVDPQPGRSVLIDATTSFMGAKIAEAARQQRLNLPDMVHTNALTDEVRATIGGELEREALDRPDEALSFALSYHTLPHEDLAFRMQVWEQNLFMPSAVSLPQQPTEAPAAAPSDDPVVEISYPVK